MLKLSLSFLALLALPISHVSAQITPAKWTSLTPGVSATGTIGTNSFKLVFASGAGARQTIPNWTTTNDPDYTNTKTNRFGNGQYHCAPMATNPVNHMILWEKDNWTITFASPVQDLVVYLGSWRQGTYDFSEPFAIASGMTASVPMINPKTGKYSLDYPGTSLQYGALRFSNITTLTINETQGKCCSGMWLTFGAGVPTKGCALATPWGLGCANMSLQSGRPITGQVLKITMDNMPGTTVADILLLGIIRLPKGVPTIPWPIANTCLQYTPANVIFAFATTGTRHDLSILVPSGLAIGSKAFMQGVALTSANKFASSNGLELMFGNM